MPDIYQIASVPQSEEGLEEMSRILELLLGLAIRGDNHAVFIEKMQQSLSEHTQARLIEFIKEVNDNVAFSVSESIFVEQQTTNTSLKQKLPVEVVGDCAREGTELRDTEEGEIGGRGVESADDCSAASPSMAVSSADCSFASSSSSLAVTRHIMRLKLEEINDFLNSRLLRQIKRVVDERDEYLEMVIELKQDKEQLNARLAAGQPCSLTAGVELSNHWHHHQLVHLVSESLSSPSGAVTGSSLHNANCNSNSDPSNGDYLGTAKISINQLGFPNEMSHILKDPISY